MTQFITLHYELPEECIIKQATMPADVTWIELLDEFVMFLRGCGFFVPDGFWSEYDDPARSEGEWD